MKVNVIKSSFIRENTIWIAKEVADKLLLNISNDYTLHFGLRSRDVKIELLEDMDSSHLLVSKDVWENLLIPGSLRVNISLSGKKISLGPIVGVFINPRYLKKLKEVNTPTSVLELLRANSDAQILIYFFSIDNINWLQKTVKGYFWCKDKSWRQKELPLPNVIYDRGVKFTLEEKKLVKHIRTQFRNNGLWEIINNKDCLDKWFTFLSLNKHTSIKKYLPETRRFQNLEDLKYFLEKYNLIFLKSFYGSRGEEVTAIKLLDKVNREYLVSYNKNSQQISKKITGFNNLLNFALAKYKGKKFIIQQGIELITFQDHRLDMRVLLIKDKCGYWSSIYNQVRIGIKDSFITNACLGGRIFDFKDIAYNILNLSLEEIDELDKKIRGICIQIANAIEIEFGSFGEIGMDIGLDKNFKIWFIEANSKPDKDPNLDPESNVEEASAIDPQFSQVLEYAKYLSGF